MSPEEETAMRKGAAYYKKGDPFHFLTFRNIKWSEAEPFVKKHHRHSKPLVRHLFSIGVDDWEPRFWGDDIRLVGVAQVNRCSSAWSKNYRMVELSRLCVIPGEYDNLASKLLARALSACEAMGFETVISYTQSHESGSTYKAAGFNLDEITKTGLLRWHYNTDQNLGKRDRNRDNYRAMCRKLKNKAMLDNRNRRGLKASHFTVV
jgi:hypothetical protein